MGDLVQEGVYSHFHTIAHETLTQTHCKQRGGKRSKQNKLNLFHGFLYAFLDSDFVQVAYTHTSTLSRLYTKALLFTELKSKCN